MTKPRAAMCSADLSTQRSHLQQLNSGMQQLGCSSSVQQVQAGSTNSPGLHEMRAQLLQTSGSLASLLKKQQHLEAQRSNIRPPSCHQHQAVGASMHDSGQALTASPAAENSPSRPGTSSSLAVAVSPQHQLDALLLWQSKLQGLEKNLAKATRASTVSDTAVSSGSRNSGSTDQPLTPALAPHAGHQQTQKAATAQQVAVSGIKHLQDVAQSCKQACQMQRLTGSCAAGVEPSIQDLIAILHQFPKLRDPSALQQLIGAAEHNKQLRQDLFAKNQSLNHALQALHVQTHTPADKKTSALQQQVRTLHEQLLARDAALAAAEDTNKRLRGELGIPQSGDSEYLSPGKLTEGPAAPGSCSTASPDIMRRLTFGDERDDTGDSMCSNCHDSSSSGSQPQQQLQQQQDVPVTMIGQLAASYRSALDAKTLQVQQLQQQLADLHLKQQSSLPAHPSLSSAAVPQRLKLAVPRTLDEAVQQTASLKEIFYTQQRQMLEQEQQSSRRAAERETAFKRQLEVEKKQHECTRENCKLITGQLEDLQEKVAKSRAQEMHLQQQLEQAREKLRQSSSAAAAGIGTAGGRSKVDHISQLQQHVSSQKQRIAVLQSNMLSLHRLVKDAGRLIVVAPAGQQAQQSQDLILHLQLEASIKQLLTEASRSDAGMSMAATFGNASSETTTEWAGRCTQHAQQQQQQQQLNLQQLQQQLGELDQENDELRQEVDYLAAYKVQSESEIQQNARRLQQSEQLLAGMVDLSNGNRQLQQELADTRAQLDKALQEQQLAAAHLEQCRQQLGEARQRAADCEAERDNLKHSMRELANRAAAAEVRGRGTSGSASTAEVLQLQACQACPELNQQVLMMRQQLGSGQVKEERLQVMNAQLQERNAQLQEQISNLQVGARDDAATLQTEHLQQQSARLQQQQQTIQQQQQHIQELQQQLQQYEQQLETNGHLLHQQEQQMQDMQQQLQQKEQQLQKAQQQMQEDQQQQLGSAGDAGVGAELEQLKLELEDRTQELLEWQIHADALENDLADLKERADVSDSLQEQLSQQQQHTTALEANRQQLQQELEQTKGKMSHLEFNLHDAAKNHTALLARFEAVSAELSRVKEGAADMRLRLDHFTGPAGPQARTRQLEVALQSLQRKYEAADTRAAQTAAQLSEQQSKLSGAEDEILALEGQVSILESELAKHTQQILHP